MGIFPHKTRLKFVSLTDDVSDAKSKAIQRYLNNGKDSPIAHVNTYSPGRRQAKYYRLSYRLGNRTKHLHIPGGSTTAKRAQVRAKKILKMIARDADLEELLAIITRRSANKKLVKKSDRRKLPIKRSRIKPIKSNFKNHDRLIK